MADSIAFFPAILAPTMTILLAVTTPPVLADTTTAAVSEQMEEVIVEGTTERAFSNVIPGGIADLEARRTATSDVARLLEGQPGLSFYSAGGVSSLPVIRGLADDRIRVRLDGMDLVATCPNHMNPPLSYVAPSQVATARVYAGISPVSVGGDSIGGTIEVDTRQPEFSASGWAQQARIGGHYRSNEGARGIDVGADAIGEQVHVSYSGAYAQADNYKAAKDFKVLERTGRPGHALSLDEVGSSGYETQNHQFNLAMRLGEGVLDARISYQDMPYQNYPNQRMDLIDNTQTRVAARYRGDINSIPVDVLIYRENVEHRMDFGPDKRFWYGAATMMTGNLVDGQACAPLSFICAAGMPMNSDGSTSGLSVKADFSLGSGLLRSGADYQAYRLNDRWPASGSGMWPGEFVNINDGERDRVALFGEWEQRWAERWTGLVGLRFEHVHTSAGQVKGYDTDPLPPGSAMMTLAQAAAFNAGPRSARDVNFDFTTLLRFTADERFVVEFGAARKSRSPNLYERYSWSSWSMAAAMNNFVGDGNGYVGDPRLDPEIAHTVSARFDWHSVDGRRQLVLSPYYTHVTNYVDAIRVTNEARAFNVLRYANHEARLFGVDATLRLPVADGDLGRIDLLAVAGWIDAHNNDSDDGLYNIMPLNTRLSLEHRLGSWDNRIEFIAVRRKRDVSQVRNEITTAGYALFNLRIGYVLENLRVDVGIDNLLDRDYTLPLGGAYLGQGPTMMLTGTAWGIGVPGPGRSFSAGFSVSF